MIWVSFLYHLHHKRATVPIFFVSSEFYHDPAALILYFPIIIFLLSLFMFCVISVVVVVFYSFSWSFIYPICLLFSSSLSSRSYSKLFFPLFFSLLTLSRCFIILSLLFLFLFSSSFLCDTYFRHASVSCTLSTSNF